MTAKRIPYNALVVVADGAGARFFRNSGDENKVSLSAEGEFKPTNILDDGLVGRSEMNNTQHAVHLAFMYLFEIRD